MRYVGCSHFLDKPMSGLLWLGVGAVLFGIALACVMLPPLVIAVPAGLIWLAICVHRPFAAFCMVLFLQVFDTLLLLVPAEAGSDASFINTLTATKLLLLMLMGVSAFRILLTKDEGGLGRVRKQIIYVILCALFILLCFPGLIYSGLGGPAIQTFSRLGGCVVLAVLAIGFIRDFRSLCCVFSVLLPAFIITSIIGIGEILTQTYLVEELGREISQDVSMAAEAGQFRVAGPSGDPVYYAVSMILAITTALVVMQFVRHWGWRLLCVVSLGLFGLSLFSTASRGGLLGAMVLGGVFFMLAKIRAKWFVLIGVSALGVLILTVYTVCVSPLTIARLLNNAGADEATDNRLGFYSQCMRMSEDSPVFGVGLGQFKTLQVNTYFDSRTPRRPYLPHNVYLQILAETGPMTLAIYIAIIAHCVLRVLPTILAAKDPRRRNVGAVILAGVLGLAAFATNTNLRENEMVWLMFSLAIVASHVCLATETEDAQPRRKQRGRLLLRGRRPAPPVRAMRGLSRGH